jgi:elongator complex protein 2
MMETSCKLSFHGASGNSCPHSLLWVQAPCSATTHDGQASDDGGGGDESNKKLVDTVIYASSGVINLATSHKTTSNNCITSVAKTLITRTLDHSSAPQPSLMEANHTDDGNVVATAAAATKRVLARGEAVEDAAAPRSITALTWFVEANHTSFGIVSAFSDGTVTIWKKCNNNEEEWAEHVLIGHDPDTSKRAKHLVHQENFDPGNLQESIADISAVSLATNTTLVATASSKGIIVHIASQSPQQREKDKVYSRQLSQHASASAHFVERKNNECYLFAGSASPRHNKVWVYTIPHFSAIADDSDSAWVKLPLVTVCDPICHGSLLGHQDWISCFAWLNLNKCNSDEDREEALLASSGHDAKIRLWKFSTRASQPLTMTSSEVVSDDDEVMGDNVGDDDTTIEGEDEEDEANIDDLEEEGEARLMIYHGGSSSTAVSLEALLFGHEESVTSLTWRNRTTSNSKPCLLSSSMDRTILLWMEDEDVWAPISRVGSAGGILGGSIGASLMGFVDARFSPESNRIVGHGYGGSIHLWTQEELDAAEKQEEEDDDDELLSARWVADPCITGHFRSVEDMAWDPQGEYLLTTSSDQTTRLWAEVMVGSTECRWVEVGRPQVHGYDMTSIACVGGSETASSDEGVPRHRFISGADEKVLRVFDAPISTLRLLQSLKDSRLSSNSNSNSPNEDSMSWRVERAFLPSLGLSNKATADQEQESSKFSGPTNDDEFAETLDTLERKHEDFTLPSERDLGVTTLWPESRKLFGHESELVCLDSYRALSGSDEPSLVASSCKARNDVASAAIRLWNAKDGKCVGILKGGHRSTVSTMSFSSDGRYLASSGKDRRICIWKKVDSLSNSDDVGATGGYELAAAADSAHKRIVWSVHFCPSMPNILASGSRDGFVRVWKVCETDEGDQLTELVKFEPSTKGGKKSEPVTAVAFAERLPNNDNQIGILGIGTESGRIEVWAIPVSDGSALKEPTLLHAIAATDCHFGTVKKLAWRPSLNVEGKSSSSLGFTLASCSQDSGVRIFNISINIK